MILGCDVIIALKGYFLAGKLGVIRIVTSQLGFTRAFSIRVFITRNVVPTVIVKGPGSKVGLDWAPKGALAPLQCIDYINRKTNSDFKMLKTKCIKIVERNYGHSD